MQIFDISKELLSSAVYPGDPEPVLQPVRRLGAGDGCNLSAVSMCLHNATHVDAPLHFIENGASVEELEPERFFGHCRVVAAFGEVITGEQVDEWDLDGVSRLIIKGFGKVQLSSFGALALVNRSIKLLGIDSQSVGAAGEETQVHQILHRDGIAILEGLDLSKIPSGDYVVACAPLKIRGAEAAPCRAFLLKDD